MKSGAALLQLWLVGTAVWMIGWVIVINSNCAPGDKAYLVCRPDFLARLADLIGAGGVTFIQLALWGLAVPLLVLVAGIVAFRLLRSRRPN